MKSGELKISCMLKRSEVEAIVTVFDELARRYGYMNTHELRRTFTDDFPGLQVYDHMTTILNLMDDLDGEYYGN